MKQQAFNACVLPPGAELRSSMARAHMCQMEFAPTPLGSAITLDSVSVEGLALTRQHSAEPRMVHRRPAHVRRDGVDAFILTMPLSAEFHFAQQGRECSVAPGQFALIATARPFTIAERPRLQGSALSSLHVVVPAPLLRERCLQADALCGRSLPIQPGAGKLMQALIAAWIEDGASLSPTQANHASALLIDLIGSASALDGAAAPGPDPRLQLRETLLQLAKAHIAAHLSDPDLDTERVAHHCRVSVRYLQKTFESASLSVGAYIREQRLQRCRDALRSPQLRHQSIAQIAALWGFDEASPFSRAYRHRFGVSPSDERHDRALD